MLIKIAAALVMVALCDVVMAASLNVYFYRSDAYGAVLWDASQAYFFVETIREGHVVSYLRYPWAFVKESLGGIEEPEDNNAQLDVVHVTRSGVDRQVLKLRDRRNGGAGADPRKFTPLAGRIYAWCAGPPLLCRWAGDHFEQATPEELRQFNGVDRLTDSDIDKDANGWSRRFFGIPERDYEFTVRLDGGVEVVVKNLAVKDTTRGLISIELRRPGEAPRRIWSFDVLPRTISASEYRHAFANGSRP